jgi:hypothetical protein
MSKFFSYNVMIEFREIVRDLASRDIATVTSFLEALVEDLGERYTPEEDKIIAFLPEDIYFGAIIEAITSGIATAKERVNASTRKAFAQPTHDQIQEHIEYLKRRRAERLKREQAVGKGPDLVPTSPTDDYKQHDLDVLIENMKKEDI